MYETEMEKIIKGQWDNLREDIADVEDLDESSQFSEGKDYNTNDDFGDGFDFNKTIPLLPKTNEPVK